MHDTLIDQSLEQITTNTKLQSTQRKVDHTLSIAPMIVIKKNEIIIDLSYQDITDQHFRFFMRLLTKRATLYTEMIHEQAILKSKNLHFLQLNQIEHPVVAQLGGCDPLNLAKAAKICQDIGYEEVNLNVGCPSDRVQKGKFGACLMKEPNLVAEIMQKMNQQCSIPLSIKCRLGVDDFDSYDFLSEFISSVSEKGKIKKFVIHARKAFLKGLNPAQNRSIPPLNYPSVVRLCHDFPHLDITINGGFNSHKEIEAILQHENGIKGCMIGRGAYQNPWFFSCVDSRYYGDEDIGFSKREVLEIWGKYGKQILNIQPQTSIPTLNKPIINLFSGENHSIAFRKYLSEKENIGKYNDYSQYIQEAIQCMELKNPQALDVRAASLENKNPSSLSSKSKMYEIIEIMKYSVPHSQSQ